MIDYLPHMQVIQGGILDEVIKKMQSYGEAKYQTSDVINALNSSYLSIEHLKALLNTTAEEFIGDLASKTSKLKLKYFGNNTSLFTPLYLSNFCNPKCVYCGFQRGDRITGARLSEKEIGGEIQTITKSGLQEILMLTGEGREFAGVEYIARACGLAGEYFKVVGVEIYPMNVDGYVILHKSGCDYVTIFQEIYNETKYSKIHLAGEKSIFKYRFFGQERALMVGMRGVASGALLGIGDLRKDALACTLHAHFLQQKYPHAEFLLLTPRLKPIISDAKIPPKDVSEKRLLQVLCAYRLFLPFIHISLSSHERASFKDEAVKLGVSKTSAGVSTGIGGHSSERRGDGQFGIDDDRSVEATKVKFKEFDLQPMMSNSIYVG